MIGLREIVRSRRDDILRIWTHEAQRAVAARGLDHSAFADLVAEYLAALGDAGVELGRFTGRRRELVEAHFATRLRQGFELAEIVEELALLGRCIASMWLGRPADECPDEPEAERMFLELHLASLAVTDMFTRHMLEDEQTEKRYGRLLRTIALEALQPGAPPLEARLREMLAIVMEAVGAQSIVLLLWDTESGQLELAAAEGAAGEDLERHVTSLDLSSFVGQVAAHERATSIRDAATTELPLSDALRCSGIHALIGVRLPPRHRLLGVLCLGLAETRSFNPREVRRLESLGEQLTLHMEHARLNRELREHIETLEGERRLRERFVSVLAHDLRGALSAVKLNADIMALDAPRRDGGGDPTARIQKNVARADAMIRDLVDANLVVAGKQLPLHIGRCDLYAVARQAVDELSAAHGQRFVLEGEPGVVGQWSAEELRRALAHLLANALKYGATATPIAVTVRKTMLGAEVSVHNYGPPIAPDDQRRLCEPPTARAARIGGRPGWGLGLALVHGCAQAHGGRVRVSSTRGDGTRFTLELPLDAAPFQGTDASEGPDLLVH